MTERPTIFDCNDQPLKVGDRVRLNLPAPMPSPDPLDDGSVLRAVEGDGGWGIEVEWPDMDSTCIDWYPVNDAGLCPDLQRIDTNERGEQGDA